jgi:ABC-type antimicrobial peptide transport system permease subunit
MLLSAFGGLAVVLAGIGLYGVVAATVNQRTREVGIRVALGANHRSVIGMVMKEALWLVGIGAGIGVLLGAAAAFPMRGALHGVSPADPQTFLGVIAVLVGVAVIASGLPARRAVRLDPVAALRSE